MSREEKLRKKSIAERARYRRIKEDPLRYAEYKSKRRMSYWSKKGVEKSANIIDTETVTLDNGNESDDDVIEVVIDDTPIEILSDEEEKQLDKIRASVIEQSFEFTTPQTPEMSFMERKDIDPLTSCAPISDNQSILDTDITSTMSINETLKGSANTEVDVNFDKTFNETTEIKNSDEVKEGNGENSVLAEEEMPNVPTQSNEPDSVIAEPLIN